MWLRTYRDAQNADSIYELFDLSEFELLEFHCSDMKRKCSSENCEWPIKVRKRCCTQKISMTTTVCTFDRMLRIIIFVFFLFLFFLSVSRGLGCGRTCQHAKLYRLRQNVYTICMLVLAMFSEVRLYESYVSDREKCIPYTRALHRWRARERLSVHGCVCVCSCACVCVCESECVRAWIHRFSYYSLVKLLLLLV